MSSEEQAVSPWMGLALGPIVALACGYGAWVNVQQYNSFPRSPNNIAVSSALTHVGDWITLTDATFHCDTVFEAEWSAVRGAKEHSTYIPITNPDQTRAVLGHYAGRADCADVSSEPATGVLMEFRGAQVSGLSEAGLRFPGESAKAPAPLLCTSCGPKNSLLGATLFGLGALLGIAWFAFEVRRRARG